MALDSSLIGLKGPEFTFVIKKEHIRQFAQAIGDENPLYVDEEYSTNTPYGGMIAPPTFPIVIGSEGEGIQLDIDPKRMLHGEQEFIYYRSIRPGDCLVGQMKVANLYEREGKSGKMQFLVLDSEIKDESGNMVVISRMNIILREI